MPPTSLTDSTNDALELAEAYIELINRIPLFENSVKEFNELSDAHIFSRLLKELDTISFKVVEKVENSNWVNKLSNLKKLHQYMERYCQNKAKNCKLPVPDFHVIAKNQDIRELVKYCQQVFYIIFFFSDSCPNLNLGYATSSLNKQNQYLVATACNEMKFLENSSTPSVSEVAASQKDTNSLAIKRQMEAMQTNYELEIEKHKREYEQVFEELQLYRSNLEESQVDRKNLLQKIKDIESNMIKAGDFSKTEIVLKQEIDELRVALSEAEERRHEAEVTISRQNADISDYNRQIQNLTEKSEMVDQLKDKARELKQMTEKFQRSENMNDKYKKRLEDLGEVKKRLKMSEEQTLKLTETNSKLEEDIQKLVAFKTISESYKEQSLSYESKINTLTLNNEHLQFDLRNLKESFKVLEIERDRYQEDAMNFESKLRDLELEQSTSDDLGLLSTGITLDEAQTDELKTKVIKLEQEVTALRNGTRESGSTQRIIVLENMIEDVKKARSKVEEELMASHRKNLMLEEELKRVQSLDAGDKLSYDISLNLRVRVNEMEEELNQTKRKLKETEISLEQCQNELLVAKTDLSMVGKDQLDAIHLAKQEHSKLLEKHGQEKEELSTKLKSLEVEHRAQIQTINQLLMDKDALRTQSLHQKDMLLENEKVLGQLRTTLATLENQPSGATSDEVQQVKEMLAKETSRSMELREENIKMKANEENFQLKINLLTEQMKSNEKSKGLISAQEAEHFNDAINSLKSELQYKAEELENLKEKLEKSSTQHRREAAFMTSAWHELALKVHRDFNSNVGANVNTTNVATNRHAPASWLAMQRSNLNVQLKRR